MPPSPARTPSVTPCRAGLFGLTNAYFTAANGAGGAAREPDSGALGP